MLVTAVCALSFGCAIPSNISREGADDATADQPEASPELRVFFKETCPSGVAPDFRPEEPPGGLPSAILLGVAGNVVAGMVGSTVDTVGKALSSNQAVTFTANSRISGFAKAKKGEVQMNARMNCMIVVASRHFGGAAQDRSTFLSQRGNSGELSAAISDATRLSGPALFYLEATIEYNEVPPPYGANASTAFTYVPRTFYYPEFIAPVSWRYSSTRDVLLKVELAAPGQAQPFASFDFLWSGVKGGSITEEAMQTRTLPWALIPSGLTAAAQATGNLDDPVAVFPVNVNASFTETAKPRVLLKHLGEALAAQKGDIVAAATSEFKQAVSAEARATAKAATADELGKKYDAYVLAYEQAAAAHAAIPATGPQRAPRIAAARIAYVKLSAAETLARRAFREADVMFDAMAPLDPLPV
ncbi:hypothetical protein NM04_19220 [Massilia aurea]|uniref:Uncharacterized protein n=1 Tax=Massilia aurea TaxID=373040 RepID=A0A422QGU7_9BURK|nr:hypothetical protein NM04_19220 [Massilia aurea]